MTSDKRKLTDEHHQPVLGSALAPVRGHLLVRGHVGHVVHLALLALVHGLVGLLVFPAETEASPEPSWWPQQQKETTERYELIDGRDAKITIKSVSAARGR